MHINIFQIRLEIRRKRLSPVVNLSKDQQLIIKLANILGRNNNTELSMCLKM